MGVENIQGTFGTLMNYLAKTPDGAKDQIVLATKSGEEILNYVEGDYTLETKIRAMDEAGVDIAMLRMPVWQEWLPLEICKIVNDQAAEMCRRSEPFPSRVRSGFPSVASFVELAFRAFAFRRATIIKQRRMISMAGNTADPAVGQEKIPGRAWAVLAVTYFCSVCAPLCQFKVPASASWLFQTFGPVGLDSVTFGLLMSALSIIGVVLAFPAAWIAKGMGLKNTILLSMACLGVGSAVFGGASSLAVLMLGRFLEGVGLGLIGVAAPSCVTIWFPARKRGLALGIWSTWVPLGSVLAFNVVPPMAAAGGFRLPMFVLAGVCAFAFLLFALVFKMPAGAAGDMGIEGTMLQSMKLLKNRRVWILGVVFFLFSFAVIVLQGVGFGASEQQFRGGVLRRPRLRSGLAARSPSRASPPRAAAGSGCRWA